MNMSKTNSYKSLYLYMTFTHTIYTLNNMQHVIEALYTHEIQNTDRIKLKWL